MSLLSIVHEFAVLYSSRVHQKDKKWSDGRLRYYELNNKLEVLNESMLLVGADFYPHHARRPLETGVFSDGNEYTLPNGKLMLEVNEYLGCFERDLSNVFAKKDLATKVEPSIIITSRKHSSFKANIDNGECKLPRSTIMVKNEPSVSTPMIGLSLQPLRRLLGRPIGLRRRVGKAETRPTIHCAIKEKTGKKLDSFFFSFRRPATRIPPGSNKLSRRLKLQNDIPLVAKNPILKKEGSADPENMNMYPGNSNELGEASHHNLNEMLNFTQKHDPF